jgi:uronate dehydrogenase
MCGPRPHHRGSWDNRSSLRQGLHGRVGAVRLLDIATLGPPRPGEELVTADIRDLEAVTEAMEGVDATVHLAGIPHEDSFHRILETNVVGTYNVYEAAPQAGLPSRGVRQQRARDGLL